MPGLAALRDSVGKISFDYAATADGARLTYTTSDAALSAALHAWFDARSATTASTPLTAERAAGNP